MRLKAKPAREEVTAKSVQASGSEGNFLGIKLLLKGIKEGTTIGIRVFGLGFRV